MLKHLVFDAATYDLRMDTRALAPDCLIDVDAGEYAAELAEKDAILASDYDYYYCVAPGTEAIVWETVGLLLPNMAAYYPQHFALVTDGDCWTWTNHLHGTVTAFTFGEDGSLPLPPLDWLGRQVQEDLCLLDGNAAGSPLVAGHLCFGAGWCLPDKMGQSFLAIHAPVPLFAERIGRPADLLIQRLKPGRPTARVNWSLPMTGELNCAPATAPHWKRDRAGLTAANAGERVWLRSEWQTLTRLRRTNAVLFTIRTMRASLAEAITTAEDARALAHLVRTMPAETRGYKGLRGEDVEAIAGWLEKRVTA